MSAVAGIPFGGTTGSLAIRQCRPNVVGYRVSQKQKSHGHLFDSNGNSKSYLNNIKDAQTIIDRYHGGKGTVVRTSGDRVIFKTNAVIGTYVNTYPGKPTITSPTNIFQIKGNSKGTTNVVPLNPHRKY